MGVLTFNQKPKMTPFQKAFKEARSAGKDTFSFKGKKYTTETAAGNMKKDLADAQPGEDTLGYLHKMSVAGNKEEQKAVASYIKSGGKVYDSRKGSKKAASEKSSGVKKAPKTQVKASGSITTRSKADTSKKAVRKATRAARKSNRKSK